MKLKVKVAVVLNGHESSVLARRFGRDLAAAKSTGAVQRPSPQDEKQEHDLMKEFLRKSEQAMSVLHALPEEDA